MQHGPVRDFKARGKIVAVTGGGSGIGLAFARICHEHGARVIIGDLKLTTEAQRFVEHVANGKVIYQQCDVTSWDDLHNLITVSLDRLGDVPDIYVPCAGVYEPRWSNFWDDSESDSYKLININVDHPIKFTRLAMRALAGARKQGVVCLVASTAGVRGHYLGALYAASKHAVVGFTKSMGRADVEQGTKIVCILPGMVQTPLWEDRDDDMAQRSRYRERLTEALQPLDVAKVMLQMVERNDCRGGTCVLKTTVEERVVEEGFIQSGTQADPASGIVPDLSRIKDVLEQERGQVWKRIN